MDFSDYQNILIHILDTYVSKRKRIMYELREKIERKGERGREAKNLGQTKK